MTERQGACACGQLTVTCAGEPVRVSVCHCLECQRRSGAPFAQQARWPAEAVTVHGNATTFQRVGDSAGAIAFRFCPVCGTTVCFEVDRMPGFLAVPVGVFADPTFPSPTYSIYEARKHRWVTVAGDVDHHD
jgi:hypothetical protein